MSSALDANYLDACRVFVGHSKRGEYREQRDLVIVCCGMAVEDLNFGFLRSPRGDLGAAAAAVRSYFGDRGLPFHLTFRENGANPSIQALESEGWHRKQDPIPGMTLPIPETSQAPAPRLEIQEVRTRAQLVAFREAAFRGFGYPPAAAHLFIDDALLELPQVRLYAGLVGGAVVATSMLIATGVVAGIYWVSTLEEQRGRGYGEALSWAAAEGGRAFGCEIASLQASKLGRPVYARMGFEHVLDYGRLLPPLEP